MKSHPPDSPYVVALLKEFIILGSRVDVLEEHELLALRLEAMVLVRKLQTELDRRQALPAG